MITVMLERRFRTFVLLALLVAAGCGVPTDFPTPTPTPTPPPTVTPTRTPPPTPTPEPVDTGWQTLRPGIEVRSLDVAAGEGVERVTIARVDPATARFRVLYAPGTAYPVSAWAQQSGGLLALNAGYFTEDHLVTGLTISNGERYGTPYGDYAGMFAVTDTGAVEVRWLRTRPYDPVEPLREAVQSFPVLVKPGGVMGFPADADDGRLARRTVVAQDRSGRILFLVAPRGLLSLHTLAVWLTASDLDVDIALNLDGGTSSGLWMRDGPHIDSLIAVPAAIIVTGE